ncbi:zinc ribbon domain-containing protein [Candidatus Omnitrophota bacterium]
MGYLSPTLAVRNMKETIEFYKNSLGFKMGMAFPDASNPEYADISRDGMVLMFIPAENISIVSEEKLGIGVNLYMQIDGNIDEYYNELIRRGVKIAAEIKNEPYGIRDFTVEDVNGYMLTFNQVSMTAKSCMSCGMPMTKPEDFGGGNPDNLYCVHCAKADGSLKNYDETLEGMVNFMIMSQNMDRETAEVASKEYLVKMPAWSGH